MRITRLALSFPLLLGACNTTSVASEEGSESSQCVDGIDNDGDGALDCEDEGCSAWSVCGGSGDTGDDPDTGEPTAEDAELCVNEFMASNSMTLEDDAGAYPDWLELYNLTDSDIDLTGYFISDDFEEPEKHELANLTLPAAGYLILYADGDVDQGDNHLPYALDKDGEQIAIYRPDGTALNKIEYGSQATDVSAARKPDGGDWEYDSTPTPGETNGEPGEEEDQEQG